MKIYEFDGTASYEDRQYAISIYPEVFPGVYGDIVIRGNITFINILWAEIEGSGQVGKYLDQLDKIIIVPTVISPRLAGMLERRGYNRYGEDGYSKGL